MGSGTEARLERRRAHSRWSALAHSGRADLRDALAREAPCYASVYAASEVSKDCVSATRRSQAPDNASQFPAKPAENGFLAPARP
jgi:hypothetical protein